MFYTPSSAAADFGCVFGTLDLQKWVFGVSEVLFFEIFVFSCLGWLFLWLWGRFWGGLDGHFGSQKATKIASKFDAKNDWFLDRSKNGFGRLWDSKRGPQGEGPICPKSLGGGPFIADTTYLIWDLAERQREVGPGTPSRRSAVAD